MISTADTHICAFGARQSNAISVHDFCRLEGRRMQIVTFDIEATIHPDWPTVLHILSDARVKSVIPFQAMAIWADCPDGRSA